MQIRRALMSDLCEILKIYDNARQFMSSHGNKTQWGSSYPPYETVKSDIESRKLFLCTENGVIACVFYYSEEDDPTYGTVYFGEWKNSLPYGVVHRIASSHSVKGAARFSLSWAFEQCGNLKIDTHQDNLPMQSLLLSLGFEYVGIIYADDGTERMAYQKTR